MNVQKELFELFQKKRNDFELYEQLKEFISKVEHNTAGRENAEFYLILNRLSNSINNAGHEERRSNDISYIGIVQGLICNKYEDFLS